MGGCGTMQATRLCLLGAALALAATFASALLTPGETFPNLKPGVVLTPNITTYTVSSQYVKARAWAALLRAQETWHRWVEGKPLPDILLWLPRSSLPWQVAT